MSEHIQVTQNDSKCSFSGLSASVAERWRRARTENLRQCGFLIAMFSRKVGIGGFTLQASRAALALLVAFVSANGWAVDSGATVDLENKGRSTLYVSAVIEGVGTVEMLVDTGSSYATISETAVNALLGQGRAEYLRDLTGVMADGTRRVVPVYRIDSVRIGESCWFRDVEAAVFPGRERFILGLSVLRRATQVHLAFDPPTLTFDECELAAVG